MFERRHEPLLSRRAFGRRLLGSATVTAALVAFSLLLGASGYRLFGGLDWLDALLNAAMILTGMGPVDPMRSVAGKLFATFYALYSGVAFLSAVAVLIAPVVHRMLHRFHLPDDAADVPQAASASPGRRP